MRTEDIFALGLGLTPPWQIMSQRLNTETVPHELHLTLGSDRGVSHPCPQCGRLCKPHDYAPMPPQIIPQGIVTPGLLAHIAIAK